MLPHTLGFPNNVPLLKRIFVIYYIVTSQSPSGTLRKIFDAEDRSRQRRPASYFFDVKLTRSRLADGTRPPLYFPAWTKITWKIQNDMYSANNQLSSCHLLDGDRRCRQFSQICAPPPCRYNTKEDRPVT